MNQLTFASLAHVPVANLAATFNEAFAGYFIPLQLSEEAMATKMKSENILPAYSIGAFEGDRLVAFILHGIDTINGARTAYNAGTGVVPSHRGQRLTAQLYEAIIPRLLKEGIRHHQLEVIDENAKAAKVYEAVGFQTVRSLGSYKGSITAAADSSLTIGEVFTPDFDRYESFWNFKPTWQNASSAITRALDAHKIFEVRKENQLVAYAAFAPATGRIKQFAVHPHHRRQGYGRSLFAYLCSFSTTCEVTLINIDESDPASAGFLTAIGFQRFIGLQEMKYTVSE